jgi:LPS-assembly lipoprotein
MRNLLIPLLLLLTACGFHLRGSVQLPPWLDEVALQDATPSTDILPELRQALEREGVRISDTAPLTLQLNSETFSKRVISVDTAGRAKQYGLRYAVSFSLRHADGSVWLNNEQVVLHRDLYFDETAVLATAGEEARLQAEMRREAVTQVLRILQHVTPPAQGAK